jgi:hypothetical protein
VFLSLVSRFDSPHPRNFSLAYLIVKAKALEIKHQYQTETAFYSDRFKKGLVLQSSAAEVKSLLI